jgi:hypothetical protein
MSETTIPAGAMPVAVGAMPTQSYPIGPAWAAYRLPFPGAIGAREAGVCFDGEAGAATAPATPPATPPPATPPAAPPVTPTAPATGDDDPGLGEAGKKAIAAERKAAREAQDALKAAQTELETLKSATLSDSEKAIKEASNAATAAERAKWQSSIRSVRVEAALRVAGATNETLLDLALKSDLITALKVDEAGKVTDLDKAVEQLKKDIPEMFAPTGPGTVPRGPQTSPAGQAKTLEEAVAGHYQQHK